MVSCTRSQLASSNSSTGLRMLIPALLTRMSMRPNSPMTDWTMASTCWESVTSTVIPRVCRPVASAMAAALFCAFSCWRLVTATLAPASARAWAITNPNPRFPPVINATRPSSLNASRYIEFCSPFGSYQGPAGPGFALSCRSRKRYCYRWHICDINPT